jgi:hypothetical protein
LQDRLLTRDAAHDRLVQFLPGGENKRVKQVPQLFPERTFKQAYAVGFLGWVFGEFRGAWGRSQTLWVGW